MCRAAGDPAGARDALLDILLVEDVELNVTVACALLNKLGHQVQVARDGTQALAMANPDDFDLILLDIQLPDMTGFDVAAQLLARYGDSLPPWWRSPPTPPAIASTTGITACRM